jgi:hypothetical protein
MAAQKKREGARRTTSLDDSAIAASHDGASIHCQESFLTIRAQNSTLSHVMDFTTVTTARILPKEAAA